VSWTNGQQLREIYMPADVRFGSKADMCMPALPPKQTLRAILAQDQKSKSTASNQNCDGTHFDLNQ
jgi:hypothetical protein